MGRAPESRTEVSDPIPGGGPARRMGGIGGPVDVRPGCGGGARRVVGAPAAGRARGGRLAGAAPRARRGRAGHAHRACCVAAHRACRSRRCWHGRLHAGHAARASGLVRRPRRYAARHGRRPGRHVDRDCARRVVTRPLPLDGNPDAPPGRSDRRRRHVPRRSAGRPGWPRGSSAAARAMAWTSGSAPPPRRSCASARACSASRRSTRYWSGSTRPRPPTVG